MKNKINTKQILFMFGIVLLLTGCEKKHKTVIQDINIINKTRTLTLRDINSGVEKDYFVSRKFDAFEFFHIGDTLELILDPQCYNQWGIKHNVLHSGCECYFVEYNKNDILARKKQAEFQQHQQEFNKLEQKTR